MTKLTKNKEREIIDDFTAEIDYKKTQTAKPKTCIIDFRDERSANFERPVCVVPTEILRFRKDNGRIASDILSYETNYRLLSETEEEDQKLLGEFLYKKDPKKTTELKNSLFHGGQREPAIITCDGFLVNGNRRKLALEMLSKEHPGNEKFTKMKVVILPGKKDPGGPPTLKEIEQIENRYQLQSDGKAEYYNFDRALSMRRKIDLGISLKEQLRDDPNFVDLSEKAFEKEMRRVADEYLDPLECVDKYLEHLDREGLYDTVSRGREDREGRWQALKDYHSFVHKKIVDQKKRIQMRIEEEEVGKIEDAAFKIIRKREVPGCGKLHMIMREFPKFLVNDEAKTEIMKISNISLSISKEESHDKEGKEYDLRMIDQIWGQKYGSQIVNQVKKAKEILEYATRVETPITLLSVALKKLNHEKMDLKTIQASDIDRAMDLIKNIRDRIKDLEKELYRLKKKMEKKKK